MKNVSHLQQELIQETGVDPGWINNGGLFIANNKERMEEYRRLYTMGKVLGIESHLLSPEETKVDIKSTSTFFVTVKVIISIKLKDPFTGSKFTGPRLN